MVPKLSKIVSATSKLAGAINDFDNKYVINFVIALIIILKVNGIQFGVCSALQTQ